MSNSLKKVGLVLSHLHVRPGEEHKFDMLQYTISHFKKMKTDFYIVLAGHGLPPSDDLTKQVDKIIWKDSIVQKEIGVGHPYFCIESFSALKELNIEVSVKLRSCDIVLNEDVLKELIDSEANFSLTEQTCLNTGMIGDLFMAGKTEKLLSLWSTLPWNYSKSGLYNLFDNAAFLASQFGMSTSDYLKNSAKFISPQDIGWVTLEHNWDKSSKSIIENLDSKHLWGAKMNYQYYGGF